MIQPLTRLVAVESRDGSSTVSSAPEWRAVPMKNVGKPVTPAALASADVGLDASRPRPGCPCDSVAGRSRAARRSLAPYAVSCSAGAANSSVCHRIALALRVGATVGERRRHRVLWCMWQRHHLADDADRHASHAAIASSSRCLHARDRTGTRSRRTRQSSPRLWSARCSTNAGDAGACAARQLRRTRPQTRARDGERQRERGAISNARLSRRQRVRPPSTATASDDRRRIGDQAQLAPRADHEALDHDQHAAHGAAERLRGRCATAVAATKAERDHRREVQRCRTAASECRAGVPTPTRARSHSRSRRRT